MTEAFRLIEIEGSPFQRGISYGDQAKDLIQEAIRFYAGLCESSGMSWDQVKQAGQLYSTRLQGLFPDLSTELEGIAKGSGREISEIVALNARTELLYGQQATVEQAATISGEGCTGAIAYGQATQDKGLIHGQNWDWLSECANFTVVLRIKSDTGPSVLTLVEAGTLARCGLNSNGIAITGNFLRIKNDHSGDGVPTPIFRRKVLNASTMHEAMSVVLKSQRSSSINVMISDAGGAAIDFEMTPDKIFPVRPENGLLVHSNHFTSQLALQQYEDVGILLTPDSLYRDIRVKSILEENHGAITVSDFARAFADTFGSPYSVCAAPSPGPGGKLSCTVASVIMDAKAGEMYVAKQPYKGQNYWRYDLTSGSPVEIGAIEGLT